MKSTARVKAKRISRDDRLDRVFAALSDRTRRSVLVRLARAPSTISELAEPFAMSLPAVSKHIRVLEHAGLVTRDIEGRVHRCTLDPAPLATVDRWLTHYRVFWHDTLDALANFVEKGDA
jgi:DNA-binding transcriptional ArsR family regulator